MNEIKEFAEKTFSDIDARNMFIGSTLILFSRCNGFKTRYDANRENFLDIVYSAQNNVSDINMLKFHVEKINTTKRIASNLTN